MNYYDLSHMRQQESRVANIDLAFESSSIGDGYVVYNHGESKFLASSEFRTFLEGLGGEELCKCRGICKYLFEYETPRKYFSRNIKIEMVVLMNSSGHMVSVSKSALKQVQ